MYHRLLLTAGLLVLGSGAARAQLGLRAGANYASLATTELEGDYHRADIAGRPGFVLGAFWRLPLRGRWALVPELHYSYQQQQLELLDYALADGGYEATYRLTLGYLNLPVLARASFGRWYLELGPQLSLLAHAHETGEESLGSIAGSRQYAVDRAAADRYRRVDVALVAGGGLQLPSGWGLNLRASTGLLSLTEEQSSVTNYSGSLRNQVAQLALTYQLRPRATTAAR